MSNLQTIKDVYAAFGRGDIPAILDKLSNDVEWEYGKPSTDLPWLQPRRGREGAMAFFSSLAGMQIHSFVQKAFLESGDIVVVLSDIDFTIASTGTRLFEEDEVHIWYFDREGRISRFRHRVDTHMQHMASQR